MSKIPLGWLDIAARIPRRDQIVRVLTRQGTDHEAQFVVVHTNDWPSGASWLIRGSGDTIPFAAAVAWSPDLSATPQIARAVTQTQDGQTVIVTRPAIIDEALDEVERTRAVLALLPIEPMDWSPHPDVPNLRVLAQRLVRIVARMGWVLELEGVELSFTPDLPDLQTPGEIVETFEANASTVREMADRLGGEELRAPWLLERDGIEVLRLPRGNALRVFGITPLVYHRAEVAMLLTAMGIAVPHPYPLWTFKDAVPPEPEEPASQDEAA
ncbi:MAG: hypothetical protein AAF845_07315 [Bacteroidota bacterium]